MISEHDSFDVGKFLDAHRIGLFHITVVTLCALTMMVDGYNLYVIAFLTVPLANVFHVSTVELTPIVVSQFVGVAVGIYALSPLADRFGRRTTLLICIGLFGFSALLLLLAKNLLQFEMLRFVTGVFFAGILPNAIALASEMVPKRVRTTAVGILYMGFSAGVAGAAVAAGLLLKPFGWQAPFVVGGMLPLLLLPLLYWLLPESIRFMVNRNPQDPRIARVLGRASPNLRLPEGVRLCVGGEEQGRVAVRMLFRDGRSVTTLLMWGVSFFLGMNLALLGAWLPTILSTVGGVPIERAIALGGIYSLGFIPGALLFGILADALRAPAAVLAVALLISAAALVFLPYADRANWQIYLDLFLAGSCNGGATSILSALAASLYPTGIRATGIGWAIGMGRIANVVGPAIGGAVLGARWHLSSISIAVCAGATIAAIGAAIIWRMQRRDGRLRATLPQAQGTSTSR